MERYCVGGKAFFESRLNIYLVTCTTGYRNDLIKLNISCQESVTKLTDIISTKEASECKCQAHFSVICQVLVRGMKNIMKFDAKIDYSETKEDECGTMIKCTQRQQSNENPTNYGIYGEILSS